MSAAASAAAGDFGPKAVVPDDQVRTKSGHSSICIDAMALSED